MSFEVAADAYQAFMGRYADPLADRLLSLLAPTSGQRALDVGAGSGAVASRLAHFLGEAAVAAVDPSPPFVTALRTRLPNADVRLASAESLPFADATFDLAIAQLVVQFMTDADRGLAEMARVTRHGGRVAVAVWDFSGGRSPLSLFWQAANELFDNVPDESGQLGTKPGELARLLTEIGDIGVNLEDLRLEHTLGQKVGLAHIAVMATREDLLTRELAERGWTVAEG